MSIGCPEEAGPVDRLEDVVPGVDVPESRWGAIRKHPAAWRLAIVRFAGQFGDGMFQMALSGAILFNPERQTEPVAIAGVFALLLLPYSLIGPYAGALLDRWDRRAVLLGANLLRIGLIALVAAGLLAGIDEVPLLLLALAVVGISRFVLAGISAALPRVLPQDWLVPTNSVLATVASGCAGVGAAAAVGVINLVGAGDRGAAVAVAVSAAGSVLSTALAAGFAPRVLGPEPGVAAAKNTVRAIATGLRTGVNAVWQSIHVTTAMVGIGTHRIVFGINTLIMVLVLRQAPGGGPGSSDGLNRFGVALTVTASGMLVAAVVAPLVIPRLGRPRTVIAGLLLATLVQLTLVTPTALAESGAPRAHQLLLIGAFLLGLAGQTIKLTGDATMQIDIDDTRRGQVFALQDTVFNIAFVLAIAVTALLIPADGRSLTIVLTGGGIYCAGIAAIAFNTRRGIAT